MKVKVIRAEVLTGISKQTNEPYISTKVTVIFPDGKTAFSGFVPSELCEPGTIAKGDIFDMYRDEKGYILVFDLLQKCPPVTTTAAAPSNAAASTDSKK